MEWGLLESTADFVDEIIARTLHNRSPVVRSENDQPGEARRGFM